MILGALEDWQQSVVMHPDHAKDALRQLPERQQWQPLRLQQQLHSLQLRRGFACSIGAHHGRAVLVRWLRGFGPVEAMTGGVLRHFAAWTRKCVGCDGRCVMVAQVPGCRDAIARMPLTHVRQHMNAQLKSRGPTSSWRRAQGHLVLGYPDVAGM